MVTELVVAGASAIAVPAFLGGLIAKIPYGVFGAAAAGILGIWLARKMTGIGKAVVVGASAGLLATMALSFVPQLTAGVSA